MALSLQRLAKHERLAIIRNLADVNIINMVVDKRSGRVANKDGVFRWAWYALFQRFKNTIRHPQRHCIQVLMGGSYFSMRGSMFRSSYKRIPPCDACFGRPQRYWAN